MNLEKNYDEIFEIVGKYASWFAKTLRKDTHVHIATKLQSFSPKVVEEAFANIFDCQKFFPTLDEIFKEIQEVKKSKKTQAINCSRCKGSGMIVLSNKNTFLSASFACDCSAGDRFQNAIKHSEAGENWVERQYFSDSRSSMTREELECHRRNYWESIFSKGKEKEPHLKICEDKQQVINF